MTHDLLKDMNMAEDLLKGAPILNPFVAKYNEAEGVQDLPSGSPSFHHKLTHRGLSGSNIWVV
jgi:hypothetical protein